jgi:glycosyltransferase involved in cell wall biosynthesis
VRVNFVLPLLIRTPIGGYRVVFEYADGLARLGHDVSIVYPRRWGPDPGPVGRVKDALWPLKKRLVDRPLVPWHRFHPGVSHRLGATIDARTVPDADATVATAWQTAKPVAALPAAKGAKLYLIQHYETWSGDAAEVDATWRLPLHKVVIAAWLAEVGRGLGADDMCHIPNGLDFSRFRVTRPIENRPMRVVSMYHHEPFKGVPNALAALASFHEIHPDVPVTMFGTPARGPDIPDWIAYRRDPSQEELVDALYNGHSVYLGASLQEGWGLPPMEAMACGCTFVGTDIGGFREFAVHGETALLSVPGDIGAMTGHLVRFAREPALRERMQLAAARHVRRFTWERACASLVDRIARARA